MLCLDLALDELLVLFAGGLDQFAGHLLNVFLVLDGLGSFRFAADQRQFPLVYVRILLSGALLRQLILFIQESRCAATLLSRILIFDAR